MAWRRSALGAPRSTESRATWSSRLRATSPIGAPSVANHRSSQTGRAARPAAAAAVDRVLPRPGDSRCSASFAGARSVGTSAIMSRIRASRVIERPESACGPGGAKRSVHRAARLCEQAEPLGGGYPSATRRAARRGRSPRRRRSRRRWRSRMVAELALAWSARSLRFRPTRHVRGHPSRRMRPPGQTETGLSKDPVRGSATRSPS
jgi:hypothetical protein